MRRLLVIAALLAGMTATASTAQSARSAHGPLTGKWTGVLTDGTQTERITFTVNGKQNAGTWKVDASCHGTLTLDSISGGSHHFLRHISSDSTCAGGDIDCLSRTGKKVFDNVTPRQGGWSRSGTLHRVR